jgi:hypothetical protein
MSRLCGLRRDGAFVHVLFLFLTGKIGMPKDYAERITRLLDQRSKLTVRLNTLGQKAKSESRKLDTRRKIIVGGTVLAYMEKDARFASLIRLLLDASVGRPSAAIKDLLAPVDPPAPSPAPVAPKSRAR